MTNLQKGAKTILNKCMALTENESCLIIFDRNKADIAEALFNEANKITKKAKLLKIPVGKVHGEEQTIDIEEEMKKNNVIIIATTMSLSHTNARREACKEGARIASMPGITIDMMNRSVDIDYDAMKKRTKKLADILTNGNKVRISTDAGTNLNMDMTGLKCSGTNAGIFDKPGKWGNLPEGEACMAPIEGSTNGVLVVDASMGGIGLLKTRIVMQIKDGIVESIEGADEADQLRHMLNAQEDKTVFNIAELGIGTNDKAIITGDVLEDEKVMGTAHVAIGDNTSYDGGKVKSSVHLDGVFKDPTIYIDEKKIIDKGKFNL